MKSKKRSSLNFKEELHVAHTADEITKQSIEDEQTNMMIPSEINVSPLVDDTLTNENPLTSNQNVSFSNMQSKQQNAEFDHV